MNHAVIDHDENEGVAKYSLGGSVKKGFSVFKGDSLKFALLSSGLYLVIFLILAIVNSSFSIFGTGKETLGTSEGFFGVAVSMLLIFAYTGVASYFTTLWATHAFYGETKYMTREIRKSTVGITIFYLIVSFLLLVTVAGTLTFFSQIFNVDLTSTGGEISDERAYALIGLVLAVAAVASIVSLILSPIIQSIVANQVSAVRVDKIDTGVFLSRHEINTFVRHNFWRLLGLSIVVSIIQLALTITVIGVLVAPVITATIQYSGIAAMLKEFDYSQEEDRAIAENVAEEQTEV